MEAGLTPSSISTIREVIVEWNVKVFVLGSLALQGLLFVIAAYRKRTSNRLVQYLLRGVYELSSIVADAAFFLTVATKCFSPTQMPFGIWAAFTLLHLAGQGRLTAYSLDDCKDGDWLKFFKSVACRYVVHFVSGLHRGDPLPFVTVTIFSIAIVRLFAKTLRLLLAMQDVNRAYPLLDPFLLSLKDDHEQRSLLSSSDQRGLEQSSSSSSSSSSAAYNLQIVLDARCLLRSSLRSIANIQQHSPCLLQAVQTHFASKINPEQAMRIVEVELSFIYDSFYTDGIIRRYLGCKKYLLYALLSSYAWLCCVIALITFINLRTREHYSGADDNVTCILLWGTLILEVLTYLMTLFSDWTIASLGEKYGGRVLLSIALHKLHWLSDLAWLRRVARAMFRQWSETIPRLNYLAYGMKQPEAKLKDHIRLWLFTGVSTERYTYELGIFIFEKLRCFLNKHQMNANNGQGKPSDQISSSGTPPNNGYSPMNVFKLHIATEILYNRNKVVDQEQSQDREYSKLLSEYMAYLLFMKPHYFTSWQEDDPFKEIKQAWISIEKFAEGGDFNQRLENFWVSICRLEVPNDWTDMINIIKEVTAREVDDKVSSIQWNYISEKWIELLLHVAINCEPIEHVQELRQGGQLVSHVWLLALHFGFSSSSSKK